MKFCYVSSLSSWIKRTDLVLIDNKNNIGSVLRPSLRECNELTQDDSHFLGFMLGFNDSYLF